MTQTADHGPAGRPDRHLVQFYDAEPSLLVQNVARFIDEGLESGESVLVVATPEHTDAFFLGALGGNRQLHDRHSRRLVLLDARTTLDEIMCEGQPDWQRFEHAIGRTVRGLRRAKQDAGLRAYGEMVGLLWAAGMADAAMQLEKFWNVLLSGDDFTLYCAYPVDVFGENFDAAHVHEVLCTHSHVVPAVASSALESALDRAIQDVLGEQDGGALCSADGERHAAWGDVPRAEAMILWLRDQRPEFATEIVSRARSYYRACA